MLPRGLYSDEDHDDDVDDDGIVLKYWMRIRRNSGDPSYCYCRAACEIVYGQMDYNGTQLAPHNNSMPPNSLPEFEKCK